MSTLYCPKCGYNLTALTENRCPECGEGFDPAKLEVLQKRGHAGVVNTASSRIILFPIFYVAIALFSALLVGIPWVTVYPNTAVKVVAVITTTVVTALPILDGCRLGRKYARARLTDRWLGDEQPTPRPSWFFPLLFSAAELGLTALYLLALYIVTVGG